jgi:site-specific DNA-methyltransferase (adenine-specific)
MEDNGVERTYGEIQVQTGPNDYLSKSNPQPLNSSVNYLTNCREIALVGIKKSKPTFNSKYDNGIYSFPYKAGRTASILPRKVCLFEELIKKHSNDVVLDTFLGAGTTAIA